MAHSELELKKIYKQSLLQKTEADRYFLEERKLTNTDCGYILNLKTEDFTISNSIVLPVFTPSGELAILETRNLLTGVYHKFFRENFKYPLWINTPLGIGKNDTCILTEAIIDGKTLESYDLGIDIVSTIRASVSKRVLHLIAFFYNYIYIAFDNDEAGRENTNRVISFFEKYYPDIEIDTLDYYGKDINEFHINNGSNYCKSYFKQQVI